MYMRGYEAETAANKTYFCLHAAASDVSYGARSTPFSVMIALIHLAGVTSNAGL